MEKVEYLTTNFIVIRNAIYELVDNYLLGFIGNNQTFYAEFNGEIREFVLYTGKCLGHGVRETTWETRIKSIDGEIDMKKYEFAKEATKFCRYVNDIELKCKYPNFLNAIK